MGVWVNEWMGKWVVDEKAYSRNDTSNLLGVSVYRPVCRYELRGGGLCEELQPPLTFRVSSLTLFFSHFHFLHFLLTIFFLINSKCCFYWFVCELFPLLTFIGVFTCRF